jgi:hypothetical protein
VTDFQSFTGAQRALTLLATCLIQSVVQHPSVLYYLLLTILSLSHTCS